VSTAKFQGHSVTIRYRDGLTDKSHSLLSAIQTASRLLPRGPTDCAWAAPPVHLLPALAHWPHTWRMLRRRVA
jgi:hypothetical protein